MASTTVTIELPDDLVDLVGTPEEAAAWAWQTLVLDLLREARISQGYAAQLLGVTHGDILDPMVRHAIPSGPMTAAEVDREIEAARQLLRRA